MLESMEKYINTFHLDNHDIYLDDSKFGSNKVDDESTIITLGEDILSSTSLNDAQQHAHHLMLQKVFSFESIALSGQNLMDATMSYPMSVST